MDTTLHLDGPLRGAKLVRREDGELVGLALPRADQWVPCTVFGYELGEACEFDDAVAHLEGEGLSVLADRWEILEADQWLSVQIQEANPRSVTVFFVDYGASELFGTRRALPAAEAANLLRRA